jgi:hypothetical protein
MQIKLCYQIQFYASNLFPFCRKMNQKKGYKLKMGNKKQINFMEIVLGKTIQKFR